MQTWQVFPIVIVIAVLVYTTTMRGKLRGAAAKMYGDAMAALQTTLATGQAAGEATPICVIATERKLLSAKIFYVGVTDRRLVLVEAGGATRTFDRRAVRLSICAKTFSDTGNMQTTISRGWELRLELPDTGRHAWRVYDHAEGIPQHPQHVQALVGALRGAAA